MMRPSERRAALGLLSVGAVLASAAGLAYLGAVSYRADQGIVAGAVDAQRRATSAAALTVEAAVRSALDAATVVVSEGSGQPSQEALAALARAHPLAARPFRVGGRGELWVPGLVTLSRQSDPVLDLLESQPRPSSEREAMLYAARRAERGTCTAESSVCEVTASDLSNARRAYQRLTRSGDTGAQALLGLARIALANERPDEAIGHYQALGDNYGHYRDSDGVSFALWADLGIAHARGDALSLLDLLEGVLDRRYVAPESFLSLVVADLREQLAERDLAPTDRSRLASLTEELSETRAATALYGDVASISLGAAAQARGEARFNRTLVYRRVAEREVVGLELDVEMFAPLLAGLVAADAAAGARFSIHQLGVAPDVGEATRTLASTGFGELLPNFVISLVQPTSFPDPLDEIIRQRSRRHLLFSGALGLILVFGLLATIRGTARERELAKLKSDFVSTVSHELKTPLTSIRMFAEMLQQGVAGSDRDREAHYQDIIVKESERLGLLIANLLDYSQVEKGARRYALAVHDAREIAREACSTFERLAEGEGRRLQLNIPDGEGVGYSVRADREVMVQALLNLLGNAAKYSDATTPIELAVAGTGSVVEFSVRDEGPGIARAEHGRIFREFYRSPSAQRSGVEGTGLGLALVKRHAAALGGDVRVSSELGQGSTFTLSIPCAPTRAETES